MSRPIAHLTTVASHRVVPSFRLLFFSLLFLFCEKTAAQCTLVCKQNLIVSLGTDGLAPVTWQMVAPTAGTLCPGPLDIYLHNEQGQPLPDDTLRCAHVGQTVQAEVRHPATGNRCTATLQVRDGLSPQLGCPEKMVFCLENTDPVSVGSPAMSDNCTPSGELQTSYLDQPVNFPCGTVYKGFPIAARIDRRWFVQDESGNTAACTEKIWIRQATIADVVFPSNRDGFALPSLACGQNPEDLELTGQPTINGLPLADAQACEVAATYTDQILPYCLPASYSVIRTWLLVDFCNSQVAQRIQIIKVEDKTPPLLTAPAPLTVSTQPYQCTATVTLPSATATDSCSAVSVLPNWAFGSGYGPFVNVPLGEHLVTYVATDACGNTTSRTMRLTVADLVPPQVVCKGIVQVSLGSDGTAVLPAAVLDGGSTDNCGSVSFSASRDTLPFAPSVTLTCADRDSILTLTLRVQDDQLLENFCPVQVQVRDLLRPTLQCPANVTLSCLQDPADLLLTGIATASDNCAMESLTSTDVTALNGCHVGSVSRTWRATDVAGNTRTCLQQITLKAISAVQVAFPPDVTVNACSAPSATHPDSTGQPSVNGQFCYPLSVTYTDQVFQPAPPPACYLIQRRWKIVDHCTYDPNGGTGGIWEKTQTIQVRDQLPPVLHIPDHLTVSPDQPGCRAAVQLSDATATDCSASVSILHDSPHATLSSGPNCSGNYPPGIHYITFTATDACGNFVQKTLRITVQDQQPPETRCVSTFTLPLSANGSATLQPQVLDAGSTDNCTPGDGLAFVVVPSVFSCQEIGIQQVVLQVSDAVGNSSSCTVQIVVTDPNQFCNGSYDLAGSIRTTDGRPVAEIPVWLSSPLLIETSDCDTAGGFAFSDVPGHADYEIRPRANTQWLNGVSTYDLVLISKHILGLQPLPSPYHMIAADANRSGSITTFDIVLLRKLILGIDDTLSNNSSWRFVPQDFQFPDPNNPFANGGFPEFIALPQLSASHDSLRFVGIKVGDTNLSANATDPRSPRDTVFLTAPNVVLAPGQAAAVPFTLPNWLQLDGFQFELNVDTTKVKIQRVEFLEPAYLNETHLALRSGSSGAAFSWQRAALQVLPEKSDSPLLVLHLLPQQAATLHDVVLLSAKKITPEVYFPEKQRFAHLSLRWSNAARPLDPAFSASPAQPNPFRLTTRIPFHLSAPDEVVFSLHDTQGRLLLERSANFPAGYGEWPVGSTDLPESGIFFYRLTTGSGEMQTGKLVRQ